ncbi:MAG: lipoprotein [Gammaproteobacteria bacterium]|nr:lipoprotein [Gammaproteobacteria bacterium]
MTVLSGCGQTGALYLPECSEKSCPKP